VGHVHLDQDVAGEEPLRADHFLAAAHLGDLLGRDQNLADLLLQPVRLHALLERLLHLVLEARVGVDDVPLLRAVVGHAGHAAPKLLKTQPMILLNVRSMTTRYTPKKIDVRMTTNVVAYTSLRLGQVTRPISLRTSDRKRRERPHHPVTLSRARPPNESSCSAIADFIVIGGPEAPLRS